MSERWAKSSDGVRIAYEEVGRGEPLLLLAGSGFDRRSWDEIRDDLAVRYRVVVFDQRGTGASDQEPSRSYELARSVDDALAVLNDCAIDRAHLCGLSRGSRVAKVLAVEQPLRVGGSS